MSILWGVLVFGEQARGGWSIAPAVVSGLVMASAVVVLARSPLLSGQSAQAEQERPGEERNEPEEAASGDHQDGGDLKGQVRGSSRGGGR